MAFGFEGGAPRFAGQRVARRLFAELFVDDASHDLEAQSAAFEIIQDVAHGSFLELLGIRDHDVSELLP